MRRALARTAIALLLASLSTTPGLATQVSNLSALVRNGQTFLTWTCPPGTGAIYRIYSSSIPITSSSDLYQLPSIGAVRDSTWYDRRLSTLTGTVYAYRVNPAADPLTPDQGLFVVTPVTDRVSYYAVTYQPDNFSPEDRTITAGQNTLRKPVGEKLGLPEPIYQHTVTVDGVDGDVYTLWTTDTPTLLYPAMANVPSLAFDCAIARPIVAGSSTSLAVLPHQKGGNFLAGFRGSGMPGEWVLRLDDPIPNLDENTFWYGYHESYDITSNTNTPPVYGTVHDYTLERIVHTVAWARRSFGIDTTRVYAFGASMGGIGSLMIAYKRPDWIAAVMSVVGKFDFSFVDDPNPASGFNPGNGLRDLTNRLWGDVSTNLPTNEGLPVYLVLNDGAVATLREPVSLPPVYAFNGKWDTTVGWAEKIPFYAAMRTSRQSGTFFWDQRTHLTSAISAWAPMQDLRYLYRFRTNLSFPAIANCSVDGDPGNGDPLSGDSVGTINGAVEWDTTLIDQNVRWETTLRIRSLTELWGPVPTPDSLVADVTPRRLQKFKTVSGSAFRYTVTRVSDGAEVQSGILFAEDGSVLTIPGVKIYRDGSRLHLEALGSASVGGRTRTGILLRPSRNPLPAGGSLELSWPAAGDARVDLLDISGRRVGTLFRGAASPGFARLAIPGRLPGGVYVVDARQADRRASCRVVVLR